MEGPAASRFSGCLKWTTERFGVARPTPVEIGVDGEALTLDPPMVFGTRPGALTVRVPRHAPGLSPAAAARVRVTEASTIPQAGCGSRPGKPRRS